jgi:hypothetical protein
MTGLLRPAFFEGQILGANDLNAHVSYDRLAAVLHERTEHTWGIAAGLELAATQKTTSSGERYVAVQLMPGRAVDRLGRVIVVTDAQDVEPALFAAQIATPTTSDRYPVYIQATEQPRSGDARPGACSTAQPTQVEESLQISFGGPGSEISILDQDAAPVADGFGVATLFDKIVVGWVRWNPTLGQFASVEVSSGELGVRHVGVVASEVVAPGGKLGFRTRPGGARFALTVAEDTAGGCELRFGKQDGNNPVSSVFSVDAKGNISYQGTLSPLPVAQTVAESGVAFDGVRLPLPVGVTEDQVSQGKVRIHAVLTAVPVAPRSVLEDGMLSLPVVLRCVLDEDRRVRCQIRWVSATNPSQFVDLAAACTYLLVASGK